MFYRRKYYIVKNEFVGEFNAHFNENNLPNQEKHGARLIGRWMNPNDEKTTKYSPFGNMIVMKNIKLLNPMLEVTKCM